MSPLDAVVVTVLLAWPWHWLIQRELAKLSDPAYLLAHGVVIVQDSALEAHSPPIGEYLGQPIWGSVRFMGTEYRFHHIQDSGKRECLAPGELFLEPGLVYAAG